MTTPDNDNISLIDFAAGRWTSCGPLFTVVWANDKDKRKRVNLLWRTIPMATVYESSVSIYHTVDTASDKNIGNSKDDIAKYISTVSHLDIILRKWGNIDGNDTSTLSLMANGSMYAQVNLATTEVTYILIPGNHHPVQRTGELDALDKYTMWLLHAIENKETNHTVLFIDSMRRL